MRGDMICWDFDNNEARWQNCMDWVHYCNTAFSSSFAMLDEMNCRGNIPEMVKKGYSPPSSQQQQQPPVVLVPVVPVVPMYPTTWGDRECPESQYLPACKGFIGQCYSQIGRPEFYLWTTENFALRAGRTLDECKKTARTTAFQYSPAAIQIPTTNDCVFFFGASIYFGFGAVAVGVCNELRTIDEELARPGNTVFVREVPSAAFGFDTTVSEENTRSEGNTVTRESFSFGFGVNVPIVPFIGVGPGNQRPSHHVEPHRDRRQQLLERKKRLLSQLSSQSVR